MQKENDPIEHQSPQVIILAAGKGTRMNMDLPKVMVPVADRPMICWVVDACLSAGVKRCIIVVGYKGDMIRAIFTDQPRCDFVEQPEQLGTGHAALMAQSHFDPQHPVDVFVLAGDGPLVRAKTLTRLLEMHRRSQTAATIATAVLDNPEGYGRITRYDNGSFDAIVEQKDATPAQLEIKEINPSYYCFRSDRLFDALERVDNNNCKGEYYVTDTPTILRGDGHVITVVSAVPPEDVHGINTPQQLAHVDKIQRRRYGIEPMQPVNSGSL